MLEDLFSLLNCTSSSISFRRETAVRVEKSYHVYSRELRIAPLLPIMKIGTGLNYHIASGTY